MIKRIFLLCLFGICVLSVSASSRKQLFNDGWMFMLGNVAEAQDESFDDSSWRRVTLPHDWSIEGNFDKEAPAGNDGGYLPTGIAWYRKTFDLPQRDDDALYQLYFEGVYMSAEVYVNGKHAGGWAYGYSSFFVDITPYVKSGKNTVAVRVDNSAQKNCRWYSGSGIYRNVWLMRTPRVHVANWGVRITTPDLHTAVVRTKVLNESDKQRTVVVQTAIAGKSEADTCVLEPQGQAMVEHTIRVEDVKPWSPETPHLYQARVMLAEGGREIDRVEEHMGFRTLAWSAEEGFLLNGKPMNLNGGCVHHDNGILGAAAYDRAEYRKVELLKQAGFNAVRTSHNIPSEAFLHACDEMGLLVIDEAFDGWRDEKNSHDYHELFDEWWKRDVEAMVCRDWNHPSIFCWSIGNEVIERKKLEVVTTARRLADYCRLLDPTRPVTSALASWDNDWEIYDPLAEVHDLVGYNYMIHKSEEDHQRVPSRVMMQTESYPNDAWKNFCKVDENPYIIGDFVWTAIDYIGESGIGRWYYEGDVPGEHYHRPLYPWHAAYCGDIDLTGLRKPISYYRSMLWNKDKESLYIAVKEPDGYQGKIQTTLWGTWPTFESWNWHGHEGKPIEVEVYSRDSVVRLYLNDQLIGEQPTEEMKAVFVLPYTVGTLKAESIREGAVVETCLLKTAGEMEAIRLEADRTLIRADGQDLSFIVLEAVDAEGNPVPVADNALSVSVSGAGSLLALGNADIKEIDPYTDQAHRLWKGRALAVVRSNGKRGKITVRVKVDDVNGKECTKTLRLRAE